MDDRLVIRAATPHDAPAVAAIYEPYVTRSAISFEEDAPSADEMSARIADSHVWLVAEDDGRVLGYAYAAPFHRRPAYRWSVEVSIYLAEDARGQGIGAALLRNLLDRVRQMGFFNAFAGTTLPNTASIALFESFGFEKIAHQKSVGYKLGAWHDVGWWQLRMRDDAGPPDAITPLA